MFFPLLTAHLSDPEAERLAAEVAKVAPRKGISWLMGGVEYAMTKDEASIPRVLPQAGRVAAAGVPEDLPQELRRPRRGYHDAGADVNPSSCPMGHDGHRQEHGTRPASTRERGSP